MNDAAFRFEQSGLHAPKVLNISITTACNLRCSHCWIESAADNRCFISLEQLNHLIREFVSIGIERIILSGGEPLLHPQFFDMLSSCVSVSDLKEICIQTNGTLLTQSVLESLCRAMSNYPVTLQISLDGSSELTHDLIRGKGSFNKTMKGLSRIVKLGMAKKTRIAFTEMRHNFEELPDIIEFADSLGLLQVVSGVLIKGGRAIENPQLEFPQPTQYEDLLTRYYSDLTFQEPYNRIGNISAVEWHKGRYQLETTEHCCVKTPYISAVGTLFPCAIFQADDLAVKRIFDRPFQDSIDNAIQLWSQIPGMIRQRSLLADCVRCPGKNHCGGGCIGRAYHAYKDPIRTEDRCVLRCAVYSWNKDMTR